jgi:hypothetical protein
MRPMQLPWWVYLTPVLAALTGGAIALVGVFAGPWVKARTDADQWRRERRLDAYAELARVFHELTEARYRRAMSDGGAAFLQADEEADRGLFEMSRAAARVQLLGPLDVRAAAADLLATIELQDNNTEDQRAKYDAFMDAARQDLGGR